MKQRTALQELPAREPASQSLFRKLENLEQELNTSAHTGQTRWMMPYADLMTLLLGLFLVLFAKAGSGQAPIQILPAKSTTTTAHAAQTIQAKADTITAKSAADSALMKQLESRLKTHLNVQGLEIRKQERGVVLSLKDNILFSAGSAELSPAARHTLDTLADQLAASIGSAPRPIRVEGHTDNTPITTSKYPSNWELSTARATNIVRYLIVSHHFRPDRLSAAGYGEFRPVQNNSSIEGKQKNRRVDIVILSDTMAQQEPPSLTPKSTPNPPNSIHQTRNETSPAPRTPATGG
jgi:chemotaxis protein MotB